MSLHFSANQYQNAFWPKRLKNQEIPKHRRPHPRAQDGFTQPISNDSGRILDEKLKSADHPWGKFVGTWDLPCHLSGVKSAKPYQISRTPQAVAHLNSNLNRTKYVTDGKNKFLTRGIPKNAAPVGSVDEPLHACLTPPHLQPGARTPDVGHAHNDVGGEKACCQSCEHGGPCEGEATQGRKSRSPVDRSQQKKACCDSCAHGGPCDGEARKSPGSDKENKGGACCKSCEHGGPCEGDQPKATKEACCDSCAHGGRCEGDRTRSSGRRANVRTVGPYGPGCEIKKVTPPPPVKAPGPKTRPPPMYGVCMGGIHGNYPPIPKNWGVRPGSACCKPCAYNKYPTCQYGPQKPNLPKVSGPAVGLARRKMENNGKITKSFPTTGCSGCC